MEEQLSKEEVELIWKHYFNEEVPSSIRRRSYPKFFNYKKSQVFALKRKLELYNLTIEELKSLTKECIICGWKHNVNVHHIIPRLEGGKNEISNYVGLCPNHPVLVHTNSHYHLIINEILRKTKHRNLVITEPVISKLV